MADKSIIIKGLINFDVNQAQKSLNDISKSFNKLEKTSFNKLNEEFKKTADMLQGIGTNAGKFIKKLSRRDAQEHLKSLNASLKEQTKLLKDAISEQEALAKAIEKTADAKEKEFLMEKRERQIASARSLMGDIRGNVQQREKVTEVLERRNTESILKAAGITRMVGAIAKEVITHVAGTDYRRMSYEAQGQAAPNKIASMLFSKNLDYGILMATGSMNRALNGSDKMQKGNVWARVADAGKTIAQHVGAGTVAGTVLVPGIGSTGGAIAGGISGVATAISNNKDVLDPALRKSAMTAEKSVLTAEEIENLRSKYSFAIDLANERLGLAPAKLAGAQAIAGYDNAGALSKRLSGAYSTGWKYGYSIPETSALLQMNSGAGLIGRERSNIGTMALMERAGLASPGETADMARRMGGVTSNQQNILKTFEQAMTKGVQTGIEKSLVKDLVLATETLAESGAARVDNIDNIMRDLRVALSSMTAAQIGRQDIIEAQNAANQFRNMQGGAGNPMGMAIQSLGIQEGLQNAGIDVGQMSSAGLMNLTTAKSMDDIVSNPSLMRELNKLAGGDRNKLHEMLSSIELNKKLGVAKQFEGITNSGLFSNKEGLLRYQKGFASGASAEERAQSLQMRDDFIQSYMAATGKTYDEAAKFANFFSGQELGVNANRKIENSMQGTGFYSDQLFEAGVEASRESLRSKPEFLKKYNDAKTAQKQDYTTFGSKNGPSLFDEGSPMVVQMSRLEVAIRQNTEALERRRGGKIPMEAEGYNSPDEPDFITSIVNKVRNGYRSGPDNIQPLNMPASGQIKGP